MTEKPRSERSLAAGVEYARTIRTPKTILNRLRLGANDAFPVCMVKGKGPYVWDLDGNRYLDFVLGKGPVSLGHAYEEIDRVIAERAREGCQLTMAPPEYAMLADEFARRMRRAEKTVFLKSGTDAVIAAGRIARAHTGRDLIAWCGYHSWQDPYIPEVLMKAGTPASTRLDSIEYGHDLAKLEALIKKRPGELAAVLVAPEPGFFADDFWQSVADMAHAAGALLIMDEVRCGYHVAVGGATELFDVDADIMTFSKGMANGYPISAVTGRGQVMDAVDNTSVFGTYFYEASVMAGALACLRIYDEKEVIKHLWRIGLRTLEAMNEVFAAEGLRARCIGPGPTFYVIFEDADAESLFFDECARNGLFLFTGDYQNVSLQHTETQIDETIKACEIAARRVKKEVQGGRAEATQDISPAGIERYASRRLIGEGVLDLELINAPDASARWKKPLARLGIEL